MEKALKAVGAGLLPPRQRAASQGRNQSRCPPSPPETLVPIWGWDHSASVDSKARPRLRTMDAENTTKHILPGTRASPACPLSHPGQGVILSPSYKGRTQGHSGLWGHCSRLLSSISKLFKTNDGFTSLQWERKFLSQFPNHHRKL